MKTFTEKQFDSIFLEKASLDYSFKKTKEMGERDRQIIKTLLQYGVNEKVCLDIGPGTGRWLQFLKKNGAKQLYASDISKVSLGKVKSICNKVFKTDIEIDKQPFDSNSMDIILSFMVLEHLRNPENFFSEILRMLRPEGIAMISIPNIVSLRSRVRGLLGLLPYAISSDPTHVRFYTPREFRQLSGIYSFNFKVLPTSISLHPRKVKKWRIKSNTFLSSLDDNILLVITKKK